MIWYVYCIHTNLAFSPKHIPDNIKNICFIRRLRLATCRCSHRSNELLWAANMVQSSQFVNHSQATSSLRLLLRLLLLLGLLWMLMTNTSLIFQPRTWLTLTSASYDSRQFSVIWSNLRRADCIQRGKGRGKNWTIFKVYNSCFWRLRKVFHDPYIFFSSLSE